MLSHTIRSVLREYSLYCARETGRAKNVYVPSDPADLQRQSFSS